MIWQREDGIDIAFARFAENILGYGALLGDETDDDWGLKMSVREVTVETPIELDIVCDHGRASAIGCVPPLYREDTTLLPVFHRMRFTLAVDKAPVRRLVQHAAPPEAET